MEDSLNLARCVTEHIVLEFADGEGDGTTLEADLSYDPSDPYALSMIFITGATSVRWTFGRDLLIDGMWDPTGDGDVHVWPCLSSSGEAVVIFELTSPDGEVLVQAKSREVNRFVSKMLVAVPEGEESLHVDLDAALGSLFA